MQRKFLKYAGEGKSVSRTQLEAFFVDQVPHDSLGVGRVFGHGYYLSGNQEGRGEYLQPAKPSLPCFPPMLSRATKSTRADSQRKLKKLWYSLR